MNKNEFVKISTRVLNGGTRRNYALEGHFVGGPNYMSQDTFNREMELNLRSADKKGNKFYIGPLKLVSYSDFVGGESRDDFSQNDIDGHLNNLAGEIIAGLVPNRYIFHPIESGKIFIEESQGSGRLVSKQEGSRLFEMIKATIEKSTG